jgi:hypothetical protein
MFPEAIGANGDYGSTKAIGSCVIYLSCRRKRLSAPNGPLRQDPVNGSPGTFPRTSLKQLRARPLSVGVLLLTGLRLFGCRDAAERVNQLVQPVPDHWRRRNDGSGPDPGDPHRAG